ncbi:MAG: Flp family type IVb pilin [Methyloligella sp. ZOD6]
MSAQDNGNRIAWMSRRFIVAEDGVTAVEYAVFMLISVAIIGALSFFTDTLIGAYQAVSDALIAVMS